jgi:hypothetical protein
MDGLQRLAACLNYMAGWHMVAARRWYQYGTIHVSVQLDITRTSPIERWWRGKIGSGFDHIAIVSP